MSAARIWMSGAGAMLVICSVLGLFDLAWRQSTADTPLDATSESAKSGDPLVALGKVLFSSKLLSENDTVSCATCHDPARSFTDGAVQSIGVLGIPVGRNARTLIALRHVAAFPVSEAMRYRPAHRKRLKVVQVDKRVRAAAERARGLGTIDFISLAERCLGSIDNPLEMGPSIDDIVKKVNRNEAMGREFRKAFGRAHVTEEDIGRALAKYVASLEPEKSPYHDFVKGDTHALTNRERRGLAVFEGAGRCNTCHSGPGLTDGLVHDVGHRTLGVLKIHGGKGRYFELNPEMEKAVGRFLGSPKAETRANIMVNDALCGFPYSALRSQTPTLWSITKTGPYFSGGSQESLRSTVAQHVKEMRARDLVPTDLDKTQLDDLLAFLHALSPRKSKRD